ncbi:MULTISPECIES: hypothetical protein [Achromobacter]|uniref:hypothetical protein n=1 Tax=Achromobacter TaxID=222 RepID=UPI0023F649DB|nr:hypothetical protein [Achromobacter anxifer]MDF8363288.1 hypothetical protein [Achromobacter anxifer]
MNQIDTLVSEPTDVAKPAKKEQVRKYKKRGAFTLTAVLVAQANRPNPEEPLGLLQSWLPLSERAFDRSGPAGYRHPGVIPALGDSRSFLRLGPAIDAYAAERNWVVQPVQYFYHPQAMEPIFELQKKEEDKGYLGKVSLINRKIPLDERVFIDVNTETSLDGADELRDLCVNVLKQAKLEIPQYVESSKPRDALSMLLRDYPFLVHHIFKKLPALHILRHKGRVNGKEDVVNHILYRKNDVSDLNAKSLMRPQMLNFVK